MSDKKLVQRIESAFTSGFNCGFHSVKDYLQGQIELTSDPLVREALQRAYKWCEIVELEVALSAACSQERG
jgi:hypothetical protein